MTDHASQAPGRKKPTRFVGGKSLLLWLGPVLLGLALWLAWRAGYSPEPVYEGRPISYWIAPHPGAYYKGSCPQSLFADSNAIPFLIKSLDRQDNALARAYSDLYSRMRSSVKRRARYPLDERRLYSACFLGDMGALASPSIPALIRALTAQDPDLRRAAAVSLQIGQREKAAIAALRAALKDTESSNEAAESLWRLGETGMARPSCRSSRH